MKRGVQSPETIGRVAARTVVPCARDVLGQPINDCTDRARQHYKPEEHAEDMPLRQQQTVLDRLPYHFILIEICGRVAWVALLLPRSQLAPRRTQVAVGQRDLNLSTSMTELPETRVQKTARSH